MSRSLLTLAFALLTAAPVRADMGPFIPAAKHAETTTSRIEIADPLPEYVGVFVKSYGPPKPATEAEFVSLEPGTVLEFAGRYHDRAELLLVPRAAAGPYPTASALVEAVSARKVPAISRDFYSRVTLPAWGPRDITLNYRVRSNAGAPEIIRTSWSPLWQWYVAALAFALAVLLGGLWSARFVLQRSRRGDANTRTVKGLPPLPHVQPLSDADRDLFLAVLDTPPAPNAALRKLMSKAPPAEG